MSRTIKISMALLVCCVSVAPAKPADEEPRDVTVFKTCPAGRALLEDNRFKAVRLAEAYVVDRAEEWIGHYVLGVARTRVGQGDKARESFARAARLAPGEVLPVLRLAETHTQEGEKRLRRLASGLVRADATDFAKITFQLKEADAVLAKGRPDTPAGKTDLVESRGLVLERMGMVYRLEAAHHKQMAKASSRLTESFRQRYVRAAEAAERNAVDSGRSAARLLRQVLAGDDTRAAAAGALYRVGRATADAEAIQQAEKAILAMADPPVAERLQIMLTRLEGASRGQVASAMRAQLQKDMQFLDRVLAKDPANPLALQMGASLALVLKDHVKARALAKKMLDVRPNDRAARLLMAEIMLRQGEVAEAEGELARLKAIYDKWDAAQAAYAEAAHEAGKPDLARRAAEKALELNPENARAKRMLAVLSGKTPDQPAAMKQLKDAVRQDPRAILAFVRWAQDNKKEEIARKTLGELETENAGRADVLQILAVAYKALGDVDKAKKIVESLAMVTPTTGAGRIAVASALLAQGKTDKAEALLVEAIAENESDAKAHFLLGRIREKKGQADGALASYRRAVELDGGPEFYRLSLARALTRKGRFDQARTLLENVDASDPAVALLLTQLDIAQGRTSDAAQLLKGAEAGGQGAMAMAAVSLRQGKVDEAIQIAKRALQEPDVANPAGYQVVLAQAYLLQDKPELAQGALREVIRLHPKEPAGYRMLGRLLRKDLGWPQVRSRLAAVGGADSVEAEIAMGEMMVREKKTDLALAVLEPIPAKESATTAQQARARALLAECLAQANRVDEALRQLDKLKGMSGWRGRALDAAVRVQVAAKRIDGAVASLAERKTLALAEKDAAAMAGVVRALLAVKRPDEARSACTDLHALAPDSPQAYLLVAQVEVAAGRINEAINSLRAGVVKAPKDARLHLSLADLLAKAGRRDESLEALEALAVLGGKSLATAMGARGQLLAAWGLYAPAAQAFAKAGQGEGDMSAAELARGRALAALGRKAEARTVLGGIDSLSKAYVSARLTLAELAETTDEGLQIASALYRAKPGAEEVLGRYMALLIRAEKPKEAAALLKAAAAAKRPISADTVVLGLRAMIEAGQRSEAAGICLMLASQTRGAQWRPIAALLRADTAAEALALLPQPAEAGLQDAAIGLAISAREGNSQAVRAWQGRLGAIERALATQSPPRSVPAQIRLLTTLAARSNAEARRVASAMRSNGLGEVAAAGELANRPATTTEAARLLLAEMALDLGLADIGRQGAMEVLQKRLTCQWAAVLVGRSNPDAKELEKVVMLLQPTDAPVARALHALRLAEQNKHADALAVYETLLRAEPTDVALQMRRAMSAERAGKLDQALTWYTELVDRTGHPVAANNAAYLVAVRYPTDKARLARAEGWVQKAVKAAPGMAALRDTQGWIAHLLGRDREARDQIRLAVQADPTSVENHYHLGVVELAGGAKALGRWHLEAAVAMADRKKSQGQDLSNSAAKAVEDAKRRLATIE